METKRLFEALLIAVLVYVTYVTVYRWAVPLPPPAATQPALQTPNGADTQPATHPAAAALGSQPSTSGPAAIDADMQFTAGTSSERITIGGGEGDRLAMSLDPRGASVASISLTEKDAKGHYRFRADADRPEPYQIVHPIPTLHGDELSYSTRVLAVTAPMRREWRLNDLAWTVTEASPRRAVLTTQLRRGADGDELLRLTKTYELTAGTPICRMLLEVENTGSAPISVSLQQQGPVGIDEADAMYAMRRVLAAFRGMDATIELKHALRPELAKGPRRFEASKPESRFFWGALVNKYFGVYTRPIASQSGPVDWVAGARAELLDPAAALPVGDLALLIDTKSLDLAAGGRVGLDFQIFAGAKDPEILRAVDAGFDDPKRLGYSMVQDVEKSCCCSFPTLTNVMSWLLGVIYAVVRNHGIAILVLVFLVRGLLHPLSVFQQKSMFRFQESMGKLQPKLATLQERFGNDPARKNQEMMKLYAEENVNPAAMFVSFIPMFLQMPILIALWTALNTDVHLRHSPFDGWWIRDLAAPDALVRFAGSEGFAFPILGWIFPSAFPRIHSLNLLPILMGVSMWLQQKYMPKPHMEARNAASQQQAKKAAGPGGMTPEEQLRQQQMIANIMSVIFPIMLYNQPAGLCVYWMFSNIVGVVESLIIRKQIKKEKALRELRGEVVKPKKPSLVGRWLQHIASQAEELQNKADEISKDTPQKQSKSGDASGSAKGKDKGGASGKR